MRRALIPALVCMTAVSGCAKGRQGLVQALRVPAGTVPVQHTPQVAGPAQPASDPNALTPLEQKLLKEEPAAEKAAAEPARTPQPGTLPPGRVASTVSHQEIRWRQDYESADRRPIETVRIGSGERRIFVTSSLHGNEADTVRVVEGAILALPSDSKVLADRALLAVRAPNPDGAADRTLTNSRGVDLNRNWPSPRFPANAEKITGDAPASEPETRALIQILADFRPTRVVHVVSGGSLRGAVLTSCEVKSVPGFDVVRTDEQKAATIEDYAATRLNAEVITLVLPYTRDTAADSESIRQLVALLTDTLPTGNSKSAIPAQTPETARQQPAKLDGQVTAVPSQSDKPKPDGTKGFVQVLPEPPNLRAQQTGDGGRYFELPPPM